MTHAHGKYFGLNHEDIVPTAVYIHPFQPTYFWFGNIVVEVEAVVVEVVVVAAV